MSGSSRFGGTRALSAALIALLLPLGLAQRASALVPNEPPDVVLPADGVTDEDAPYYFNGDATITLSDADAGADDVRLDLSVTSGVLHLADTSGLTFVAGTANDTDSLALTGTLAAFADVLDTLQLMPGLNDTATVTLTALADDLGHNGDDGHKTDSDTMDIAVNAVNDAPVVTVPGDQSIDEDTDATFSVAGLDPITVADVDAGSSDVRVSLAGNFGTVTVATTSGLAFSTGDGDHDPATTFTGSLSSVNAALDGLTFTPDVDFEDVTGAGTATLTVSADDLGNTGSGGAGTDQEVVSFAVAAINDGPVNVVPSGVGTYADVPRVLSQANANAISVSEVDSATGEIEVALTVTHGTLQLASTTGVTIVDGADDSSAVTFRATNGDTTVALDGLTFTPDPGFTGTAELSVHSDDLGHTGSGGSLTDTDTLSIEVSAPDDTVYWTASKDTPAGLSASVSRAALDGSGGANLVTGSSIADTPGGVAIDAANGRLYWSNTGAIQAADRGIWSADLDGSDRQLFLSQSAATAAGTTLDSAIGLALDQRTRRLYWANSDALTPANRGISWVSLDDTAVGGRVDLTGVAVAAPRTLAIDTVHDRVYFTNTQFTQSLAWAALDGSGGGTFAVTGATVSQPSGIAYDAAANRLFWVNGSGDTAPERLKVATLPEPFDSAITGSTLSISPLAGGGLRALALDAVTGRAYFANGTLDQISSVAMDGSGGGADLAKGSAFANSAEGVVLLRHPSTTGVPTVTGTPTVGATLTCGAVTWAADDPGAALYRMPAGTGVSWTRDGVSLAGATGPTVTADQAGTYRCTRSATNFAGTTTTQSSPFSVSPVAPRTTLGARSVAVSRTGTVTVPVSCANATCAGSVSLQTGGSALGSGTFSAAPGTPGTVTIDLTAAGRALVSGRASSDVTAVIAVTGATTTAAPLTLTSARAPSVSLLTGKAHVRAGKARVKLRCAADGPCTASYVLTATIGGKVRTIATAEVQLKAGQTKAVKLHPSRAARAALLKGALVATQTVTSDVEVGLDTTTTRSLKLVG